MFITLKKECIGSMTYLYLISLASLMNACQVTQVESKSANSYKQIYGGQLNTSLKALFVLGLDSSINSLEVIIDFSANQWSIIEHVWYMDVGVGDSVGGACVGVCV